MFPPTPTALPAAPLAPIVLNPTNWRIWAFSDDFIMVWQQAGSSRTQAIQVAIILIILIAFTFLAMKWIQGLTKTGEE